MPEDEFQGFLKLIHRLEGILPEEFKIASQRYQISKEAFMFSFDYVYEKLAEMLEQLQNAPENDYFEKLRNTLCNSLAVMSYMGAMSNTFLPPEKE